MRLVREKPYFLTTEALVPTPKRAAYAMSRRTPAGPGTPILIGRPTPRLRTSSTQASTGSTSKPNWVMTPASSGWAASASCLSRSADHRAVPSIEGWPSG